MLCKDLASAADFLDLFQETTGTALSAKMEEPGVTCKHQTVILPKVGGGYVRLELLTLFRSGGETWRSCTFPLSVTIIDSLPA